MTSAMLDGQRYHHKTGRTAYVGNGYADKKKDHRIGDETPIKSHKARMNSRPLDVRQQAVFS